MSNHQKILEEIQRKMAEAAKFKSEEEKKEKLFEYEKNESEFGKPQVHNINLQARDNYIVGNEEATKALQQIYNYYLNSYIQPRKKYQTFDVVNERKLTFQPFILFMKNFKLLKTIYSLDRIKLLFKKYANYGKYLTFENFLFMINEMAHQPQAKSFFNATSLQGTVDVETAEELDRQELYNYMGLTDSGKYKKNFRPIFQPFNCEQKPEFNKIKYSYRKFSLPELKKKALPQPKNKPEEKELFVMKNRQIVNDNPFEKAKSIVVSWESLRSKSVSTLKDSDNIIRKKYLKEDPDDGIYLLEYNQRQKAMRAKVDQKIKELSERQKQKNKGVLERLSQKEMKALKLKTGQ